MLSVLLSMEGAEQAARRKIDNLVMEYSEKEAF
jgi:hypothetical protein